ncbi:MAG: Mov34/MPN/PAD-1 family protein, partial [Microcystis panniformis]
MLSYQNIKTIFSQKSFLAVAAETYESYKTETGGIFLGIRTPNKWYILETLDSGLNPIFRPGYFEYDNAYINHLSNKIARFYREPIEVLGLWHRHPGSFDYFSLTDDTINK